MKAVLISFCVTLLASVGFTHTSFASPATRYVFRVRASIPVVTIVNDEMTVRKTLTGNDIINLALGRSLSTRVNPQTEVLALSTTFEDHDQHPTPNPVSKLIVWNPAADPGNQVTVVVATLTSLDFDTAFGTRRQTGQGIASGKFLATALGDPAKNGFFESSISGSGSSAGPHIKYNQNFQPLSVSPVGSAIFVGKLKFNLTDRDNVTTTFDGYALKGTLLLSGNAIGTFEEQ